MTSVEHESKRKKTFFYKKKTTGKRWKEMKAKKVKCRLQRRN